MKTKHIISVYGSYKLARKKFISMHDYIMSTVGVCTVRPNSMSLLYPANDSTLISHRFYCISNLDTLRGLYIDVCYVDEATTFGDQEKTKEFIAAVTKPNGTIRKAI